MQDGSVAKWISKFPELEAIDDPPWLAAVQAAAVRAVPRGTVIFRPGDPCRSFMLMLSGVVRVYLPGESGREILLYRVEPGEIFVLTIPNLLGGLTDPAECVAETDATLIAIPPQPFERALAESHQFSRYVFSMIGRRLGEIMVLLEEITFKRLDVRLAKTLAYAGCSGGDDTVCRTHHDLAAELGSSREVISRLLKDFERSGWVRLDRGRIEVLTRSELRRFGDTT